MPNGQPLTDDERETLLTASHTVEPVHHTGRALFAVVERITADYRLRCEQAEAKLNLVRGLLAAYGDAEGTPVDYEFLVHHLHTALAGDTTDRAEALRAIAPDHYVAEDF